MTRFFSYLHKFSGLKMFVNLFIKTKKLRYTAARSKHLSRVGEHDNIGIHSLRAGGATVTANSNVDDICLKRHRRWKSDTAKDGSIVESLGESLLVSTSLEL